MISEQVRVEGTVASVLAPFSDPGAEWPQLVEGMGRLCRAGFVSAQSEQKPWSGLRTV